MIFFAVAPDTPVIVAHQAEGGRSVYVRDGNIVLATGKEEVVVSAAQERADLSIENSLAAIAAAWALGISPDLMRAGIETFESTDANVTA